jgi:hypothetical protein
MEDCIRTHALIHKKLQELMYRNVIKYAQYAAKLIRSREVLRDVNTVPFSDEVETAKCKCVLDVANFCAVIALAISAILNPKSLSA